MFDIDEDVSETSIDFRAFASITITSNNNIRMLRQMAVVIDHILFLNEPIQMQILIEAHEGILQWWKQKESLVRIHLSISLYFFNVQHFKSPTRLFVDDLCGGFHRNN